MAVNDPFAIEEEKDPFALEEKNPFAIEEAPAIASVPSRSLSQIKNDTLVGITKGAVDIAGSVGRLAGLATDIATAPARKAISAATGTEFTSADLPSNLAAKGLSQVADKFGISKTISSDLQALKSPQIKASELAVEASAEQVRKESAAEPLGLAGRSLAALPFMNEERARAVTDVAAEAGGYIEGAYENPTAAIQMATEQIPQLYTNTKITSMALAPLVSKTAAAVKAGTMTKAAADKAITKAAASISSGTEGAITSGQVLSGIKEAKPDADLTHQLAAIPAGIVSAGISKATGLIPGLGNVEGKLATRGLVDASESRIGAAVKGLLSEGLLQEPWQEGQEQVWQNVGTDSPLTKDVGSSIGSGLVVGGLMGGAMGLASGGKTSAPDITPQIIEKIKGSNLTPTQLVALRESPDALARLSLTPEHIDSILDTHDSGQVEIANFRSLLESAPSATARKALLASQRGKDFESAIAAAAAAETTVSNEVTLDEAIVTVATRRKELSDKLDLSREEATELKALNKAGLDPAEMAKVLKKTIKLPGQATEAADGTVSTAASQTPAQAPAPSATSQTTATTPAVTPSATSTESPTVQAPAGATVKAPQEDTNTSTAPSSSTASTTSAVAPTVDTANELARLESKLDQFKKDQATSERLGDKATAQAYATRASRVQNEIDQLRITDATSTQSTTEQDSQAVPVGTDTTGQQTTVADQGTLSSTKDTTLVTPAATSAAPSVQADEAPRTGTEELVDKTTELTGEPDGAVKNPITTEQVEAIQKEQGIGYNRAAKIAETINSGVAPDVAVKREMADIDPNVALEQEIAAAEQAAQHEALAPDTTGQEASKAYAPSTIQKKGKTRRDLLSAKAKLGKITAEEQTEHDALVAAGTNVKKIAEVLKVTVKVPKAKDTKAAPAATAEMAPAATAKMAPAATAEMAPAATAKMAPAATAETAPAATAEMAPAAIVEMAPAAKPNIQDTTKEDDDTRAVKKARKDAVTNRQVAEATIKEKQAKLNKAKTAFATATKSGNALLANTYKGLIKKLKDDISTLKSVQSASTQDSNEKSSSVQAVSKSVQNENVQIEKNKSKPKASVSVNSSGSTIDDIKNTLASEYGEDWNKNNNVSIVQSLNEAIDLVGEDLESLKLISEDDVAVQALHDPKTGKTVIIADTTTTDAAPGVLAHEVGVHGVPDESLDGQAVRLAKQHADTEFMQAVMGRMEDAGHIDQDGNVTDANELRAYIVEEAVNRSEIKEVSNAFFNWMDKNLPKGTGAYIKQLWSSFKQSLVKAGIATDSVFSVYDLAQMARDAVTGNIIAGMTENADGVFTKGEYETDPDVIQFSKARKKRLTQSDKDKEALKVMEQIFESSHKNLDNAIDEALADMIASTKNPIYRKYYSLTKRIRSSFVRDENTQNSSIMARVFSSPEFTFARDKSAQAVLQAALDDSDIQFQSQHQILDQFLTVANRILSTNEAAYKQGGSYLVNTDKNGVGFSLRQVADKFEVKDRLNNIIKTFSSDQEVEAQDFLIEAEQKWLTSKGMSSDARLLVKEARQLTNRAFAILVKDMRDQMGRASEQGRSEPKAMYVNEDGKTEEVALSEIIAHMNDLRGTYFPRERVSRSFHLVAEQDGLPSISETFDWHLVENKLGNNTVEKMKRTFNALAPAGQRTRELEKLGYKDIKVVPVGTPSNMLFDLPGTLATLDSLLSEANKDLTEKQLKAIEKRLLEAADRALAARIADIYKAKGNLSSRMVRSEKLWEGYEEDPIRALTGYASRLATGVAKRTTARRMLEAMTGRSKSWKQFEAENPGASFTEYLAYTRTQRIDATKQKELYEDVRQYIKYFLSPDGTMGRVTGYLKAAAVFKYLGFRVGSAAINATSMFIAVPATIAGHTGVSLTKVFASIGRAISVYRAYKHNQLLARGYKFLGAPAKISNDDMRVMDGIFRQGWAEAKFNQDAARAMSGKIGAAVNTVMEKAMFMFGAVEEANRAITIFATHDVMAKHGYQGDKTIPLHARMKLAKHTSDRAHGIYGKAAKPWLVQKYRFLDAAYTFQKYQHSFYLNMLELSGKYKSKKAAAFMALMPQLVAGTSIVATLGAAIASMLGVDDPQESYESLLAKLLGDSDFAQDFTRFGIIGAAFGINLKGSLETKVPIPTDLAGLFGAPQAVVTDLIKGGAAMWKGEGKKALESFLPTFAGSAFKGYREMTEGVTTKNYAPVFNNGQVVKSDGWDFAKRFISFNPTDVSRIRNDAWNADEVRRAYTESRSAITSRYNRLMVQNRDGLDPEWAELWKHVKKYNDKAAQANPSYQIPQVTPEYLMSHYKKDFKPSKYEK